MHSRAELVEAKQNWGSRIQWKQSKSSGSRANPEGPEQIRWKQSKSSRSRTNPMEEQSRSDGYKANPVEAE